ncbi:helix-turn-helix domain-containing protein [Pedobacter sp.]|uniref:helix-turn-helix domain-containing protein n=1 Tax=Pedobacter sp. TaxID=1411316 RepID=UPI003BA8E792
MPAKRKIKGTAIIDFKGLYGDRIARPEGNYIFTELIETRSPTFDWDIKPHIHPGLIQVFYIEKGKFLFFEAEDKIALTGPCLILTPPTALHGFSFNESISGRILSIAETHYYDLVGDVETFFPKPNQIVRISNFSGLHSSEQISSLLEAIDLELSAHEQGKNLMLRSYVQQFFLIIQRLKNISPGQNPAYNEAAVRYYHNFQRLLRENKDFLTASKIATALAISPVHLNRICKLITKKPTGQLIQEYLLTEAKKFLTYTAYSVSEIAYLLHFEYPNYFARFFKKHIGLSPKEYRDSMKASL